MLIAIIIAVGLTIYGIVRAVADGSWMSTVAAVAWAVLGVFFSMTILFMGAFLMDITPEAKKEIQVIAEYPLETMSFNEETLSYSFVYKIDDTSLSQKTASEFRVNIEYQDIAQPVVQKYSEHNDCWWFEVFLNPNIEFYNIILPYGGID